MSVHPLFLEELDATQLTLQKNPAVVGTQDIMALAVKAKIAMSLGNYVDQTVDDAQNVDTTKAQAAPTPLPNFNSVTDILNWIRELFSSLHDFNIKKLDIMSIFSTLKSIEDIIAHPEKYPNLHLSQSDIASIKQLLSSGNIHDGSNMSLGKFLVIIFAAQAYEKGGKEGLSQALDSLKAIFGEDSSSIGMISDIVSTLNLYDPADPSQKGFGIDAFVRQLKAMKLLDQKGQFITNFDDHLYGSFDAFILNSNYEKSIRQQTTNALLQYFTDHFSYVGADGKRHWKNPDLVFILMMQAVMNPSVELLQSSIAGMSDSDNTLAALSQTISELMSQMKGTWDTDGKDALAWMKELMDKGIDKMSAYGDSLFKGGVFANFKAALSVILDNKDIMTAYNNGDGQALAKAFNDLGKNDINAFRDALSGASSVLSNQSSVLKGEMDQTESSIKTESGAIESILKALQDLGGFIAQSMNKN